MNGQAFLYYGDDVEGFAKVFSQIGWGATPMWTFEAKKKTSACDEAPMSEAAE